jgi:CheY-like chemotaxis protein
VLEVSICLHFSHNYLIHAGTFAFYIKARRSITTPGEYNGISRPFSESTFPRSSSISSVPTLRSRYNYHILLVEDNLINQKVLSKQLRNGGCTVHVANHGIEALDFLSRTTFWADNDGGMELSVILMDLEMPIMDGLTCTRRIRDLEREGKVSGHVPCIAVTANTRSEQMDAAIDAGMVSPFPLFPFCSLSFLE